MLVMLLGAWFGRRLEAELFVPDLSARVGDVAADAERDRGQHQCRDRKRSAAFGNFHSAPIDTSATAPKA